MKNADKIIYDKLRLVWLNASTITAADLDRLTRETVSDIREEFKKAGVDVWKGGET